MNAVGADDDIALCASAVGERHPRCVALLREADTAMSGMHDVLGQRRGDERDEVGAMHAEGRIPAGGIRHLYRRDRCPVLTEIARRGADPGAGFLHRWPEPHAFELAHAVGGEEDAGADLAERGGLLMDRDVEPLREQRLGGEQAADPAADDHHPLLFMSPRRIPGVLMPLLKADSYWRLTSSRNSLAVQYARMRGITHQ